MRPEPTLRYFEGREASLAFFDWPGEPGGPTALLVHATGFHGRCWDRVVQVMPRGWRVLAVELRGHGRSSKDGPFDRWEYYGDDLIEMIDGLGLEGIVPVGHLSLIHI